VVYERPIENPETFARTRWLVWPRPGPVESRCGRPEFPSGLRVRERIGALVMQAE